MKRNIRRLIESNYDAKEVVKEVQKSGGDEAYKKYFDEKLAKYKVNSPEDLSDEDKKKFFDEVDKGWKADKETDPDNVSEASSRVLSRMSGLVNVNAEKSFIKAGKQMYEDLGEEGFEEDEIRDYLTNLIRLKIL